MKKCFLACLVLLLLLCCGCSSGKPSGKVDDAYMSFLAGKTFEAESNRYITFHDSGYATYYYKRGSGSDPYYVYRVSVVKSTDEKIDMLFETLLDQSSESAQTDYIDEGPEPATYHMENDILEYYFPYTCMVDPRDSTYFANTYGDFRTVCEQEFCSLYIAPSGHTKFCYEHAGTCEWCGIYVDPELRFCAECPYCRQCGKSLPSDSSSYCETCAADIDPTHVDARSSICYFCNGSGIAQRNFGSRDVKVYFNGQRPYIYVSCSSCGGDGKR